MEGPIVAIGGAAFAVGAENELLHDYVIAQLEAAAPRVCLLPTAGGDPEHQIAAFAAAMGRRGCEPSSVSLFRIGESPIDLRAHLLAQDLIYVTGGSMVNLMALWREHGVAEILREAHLRGVALCGYSAGSMCWFERGISTGGGSPTPAKGLGLLGGSHCVHYRQHPERRLAYRELIARGLLAPGLALDDHVAAQFRGGELVELVRSREGAAGFAVGAEDGAAVEEELPVRTLRSDAAGARAAVEELRALRRMRSGQLGRR